MKQLERRHIGLWAVVAAGILSRLWYRSRGVRFSADPLNYYIQFLDPQLLRHDLLRSLFYMRDQPPLFNGFLGLVLKLFPTHYAAAYGAIYFAGGLVLGVTLYLLMARSASGRGWPRWSPSCSSTARSRCSTRTGCSTRSRWRSCRASALFLHRYLTSRRPADATVFFGSWRPWC